MGVNRNRNPRRMLWIGGLVLSAAVMAGGAATVLASGIQPDRPAGQPAVEVHHGGEASLVVPDLAQAQFLGVSGHTLLLFGLLVAVGGLLFGHHIYHQVRRMPVHQSMAEIADLIYETCKTYLLQQGKFLLILEVFIAVIIVFYFGFLQRMEPVRVVIILLFSLIGIGGSYGVAWYGIRINTFANSRTAFASLRGMPFPIMEIPLRAG